MPLCNDLDVTVLEKKTFLLCMICTGCQYDFKRYWSDIDHYIIACCLALPLLLVHCHAKDLLQSVTRSKHHFLNRSVHPWYILWMILDQRKQGLTCPTVQWPGANKTISWASGFCQSFCLNFKKICLQIAIFWRSGKWKHDIKPWKLGQHHDDPVHKVYMY